MAKEIAYKTPAVDWETRAFWEGAGRGELVLQRCRDCGQVQHRPRALCVSCFSDGIEHFVASGRGRVHSCTVTHQNHAMAGITPYVLAWIELEEGPRLLSNVVGCEPSDVRMDMPVRVEFVSTDEDRGVPRFRPA
jgi:uncharacterized protein